MYHLALGPCQAEDTSSFLSFCSENGGQSVCSGAVKSGAQLTKGGGVEGQEVAHWWITCVTCSQWNGEREEGRDMRILTFVRRQIMGLSTISKDAKGITLAISQSYLRLYPRLPHCLWSVIYRGER